MQEALKKNNLVPGAILGGGLLAMVVFHFHPVGLAIFAITAIAAGIMKSVDLKNHVQEVAQEKEQARQKAEEAKLSCLTKVRDESLKPSDEITPILRKINSIGHALVTYDPADNEIVAEILKAYRVYIDKYLEGAATLAGKYRRARDYINSQAPPVIRAEINTLDGRIADGEHKLMKIREEMMATLHRLEEMQKDQPEIRHSLEEIHATLQSLESSIKRAENDPDAETEIREEIQRTISSTSEAIEITLVKAKREVPVTA